MGRFAGGLEFRLRVDRERLRALVGELDRDRLRRDGRDHAAEVLVAVVRQRACADRENEGDDRKQLFHSDSYSKAFVRLKAGTTGNRGDAAAASLPRQPGTAR